MKKMLVRMAGFWAVTIVNAGNVVDAEDMKVAKDITFDMKSLEYKGNGVVSMECEITSNDETKNPLVGVVQLRGKMQNSDGYYVNIGGRELDEITYGSELQKKVFNKQAV